MPVGRRYSIANRGSGGVFDVVNCGTANGTAVRQWAALGNPCQPWSFTA
jgi:Ricin-type beta-trefoil lectin domain-like